MSIREWVFNVSGTVFRLRTRVSVVRRQNCFGQRCVRQHRSTYDSLLFYFSCSGTRFGFRLRLRWVLPTGISILERKCYAFEYKIYWHLRNKEIKLHYLFRCQRHRLRAISIVMGTKSVTDNGVLRKVWKALPGENSQRQFALESFLLMLKGHLRQMVFRQPVVNRHVSSWALD